jgi:hypothetical protein
MPKRRCRTYKTFPSDQDLFDRIPQLMRLRGLLKGKRKDSMGLKQLSQEFGFCPAWFKVCRHLGYITCPEARRLLHLLLVRYHLLPWYTYERRYRQRLIMPLSPDKLRPAS